ncbi:MAG: YbgC/FadM family acyl-CoA thioesterase [Epsilonproteobacteria bacterium]|nr:YbgC/FadM family acyl-CoA thioesterase [Campylobacterota bacterium]
MQFRVYYEDTDAGGVVYHTKYLAFCERARSELFFQNNIYFQEDGFVVRDVQATFYLPARLGDLIDVHTKVDAIKKSIAHITQDIYKQDQLLFHAQIKLVFLKNWQITPIPLEYTKILEALGD